MSFSREGSAYPPVKDRMSRARTPLGSVPISTIYGYDYPLSNGVERDFTSKHESIVKTETEVQTTGRVQPLWKKGTLTDAVDYMVRSSRAFSENRLADPYYTTGVSSSSVFMPMALRESRSNTPLPSSFRDASVPPVERITARKLISQAPEPAPKTASMTIGSSSPWDSTGFYYSPRYPQSHRALPTSLTIKRTTTNPLEGTASTYTSASRRYPVRRFVPSYVPFRYSRRNY